MGATISVLLALAPTRKDRRREPAGARRWVQGARPDAEMSSNGVGPDRAGGKGARGAAFNSVTDKTDGVNRRAQGKLHLSLGDC
jgi:hypothetical protein